MREQPMIKQRMKPTRVPHHIWVLVSKVSRSGAEMVAHLVAQLLVHGAISVLAELLLDEGEEDRDNNAGLESLSEDDEEDLRCEDVGHGGQRFRPGSE
jgi:hypothetical protein